MHGGLRTQRLRLPSHPFICCHLFVLLRNERTTALSCAVLTRKYISTKLYVGRTSNPDGPRLPPPPPYPLRERRNLGPQPFIACEALGLMSLRLGLHASIVSCSPCLCALFVPSMHAPVLSFVEFSWRCCVTSREHLVVYIRKLRDISCRGSRSHPLGVVWSALMKVSSPRLYRDKVHSQTSPSAKRHHRQQVRIRSCTQKKRGRLTISVPQWQQRVGGLSVSN